MNIEIKITADEKALEFSRNLGGIANYFKEALMTNAMEESGINVREICEPENQKVEIPASVPTIEPDPAGFEQEADEPKVSAEQLRKIGVEFGKTYGKEAMRKILDELNAAKLSDLDQAGRNRAYRMISEAMNAQ